MIKLITDKEQKKVIARSILESLTEWFEVEESREQYIAESPDRIMVAAEEDGKIVGFLNLKETGKETVELAVMGVLKE
ncbi:MAG TPA: GNAT family N-acetyltransferase, partial [Eubacterium sp.]|nr:GNAT family N-acetyltransferase [Eubacterium sp.]